MKCTPPEEREACKSFKQAEKALRKIEKRLEKREETLVHQGQIPARSKNLGERVAESMKLIAFLNGSEINENSRTYKLMQDEEYSNLITQKEELHQVRDYNEAYLEGLRRQNTRAAPWTNIPRTY